MLLFLTYFYFFPKVEIRCKQKSNRFSLSIWVVSEKIYSNRSNIHAIQNEKAVGKLICFYFVLFHSVLGFSLAILRVKKSSLEGGVRSGHFLKLFVNCPEMAH